MRNLATILLILLLQAGKIFSSNLPKYNLDIVVKDDWLVEKISRSSALYEKDNGQLVISNGIVSRTFSTSPNGSTIALENLQSNESYIRSVRPEALITIDGKGFEIGGLKGQPIHNYLMQEWISEMKTNPASFKLSGYKTGPIRERFKWKKRICWMPLDVDWPPPGLEVIFTYKADNDLIGFAAKLFSATEKGKDEVEKYQYIKDIIVNVHYEIYDGLPLICKWITVENHSDRSITLNSFTSEIMAFAEPENSVGDLEEWRKPNFHIETDYSFGGGMTNEAGSRKSFFWETDSLYKTQINYNRVMPCVLECKPALGPEVTIKKGETFESFRSWELLFDSYDRERRGLSIRKMYRTIAPWVTENPVLMHVRKADNKSVKKAIDQCADTGFEMVIMTFGSGFNLENESPRNVKRLKELTDYAHSKGIALGGYSLLASRRVGGGNDVVMPDDQKPRFGNSPCLESEWGHDYFRKLYAFYEKTGSDILEHDGSYPGDVCISKEHPGHTELKDSQWKQFKRITDFYKWCRGKGIYLNVPDWYFLNGSNKTGMGYRETNWSLPRANQEIIERQNIYDGTWSKTPSMGWMFVPLVEYHGGGAEATIEPLKEHLPHYGQRLANLFGAGVQACYRGPQLYDSSETRVLVKKWVDFYKKHRSILDSDIIHWRRPDGMDLDGILHVNPELNEKGLFMVYNPLDKPVKKKVKLNLYYTGLDTKASISKEEGEVQEYKLDRNYNVELEVEVPAKSQTWYLIK